MTERLRAIHIADHVKSEAHLATLESCELGSLSVGVRRCGRFNLGTGLNAGAADSMSGARITFRRV